MRPNLHNFNIDNLRELFAAPLAHSQESDLIDGLLAALAKATSHAQYLAYAIDPNKEQSIADLHSYLAQQLPAIANDCSLEGEDLAPTDGRGN